MSLLKQAIVDAGNLKEAALKNAEQIILEKYSNEIKSAVDSLLEAEGDELGDLGGGLDMGGEEPAEDPAADPMAAPPPEGEEEEEPTAFEEENLIPPSYMEGEAITSRDGDFSMDTPGEGDTIDINISPEELAQFLQDVEQNDSGQYVGSKLEDFQDQMDDEQVEIDIGQLADLTDDEELGLTDDDEIDLGDMGAEEDDLEGLERMVAEALGVDYEPEPHGHPGSATTQELETAIDMAMAKAMSDESQEENEELKDSLEKLEEKVKSLRTENKRFKSVILQLKDKLEESIVTNAKLLYSNRVLISASLNERQKQQIVEALTNAHTVEEAKTIYETLQSTVVGNKPATQSLSEAIVRQSGRSSILPRRAPKQEALQQSALSRMQKLAGIK